MAYTMVEEGRGGLEKEEKKSGPGNKQKKMKDGKVETYG